MASVSLNWVLAAIICIVVLSVAGATLGITMAVSLDALTAVGSERALSLTTDVADLSSSYLDTLASDATSTRDIAKMLGAKPADLAGLGTNWTSLYATSMFTALSDSNFTLFRAKIVFQDLYWMQLLSRCAKATDSTCQAWWEPILGSSPQAWSVGGKAVKLSTFADTANFAEEANFAGIDRNPYAAGTTWAAALVDKSDTCAFGQLKFYYTAATGGRWVLPAACNLHNSSGVYLGRVEYEAFIDVALGGYVNTVERSQNSVLFVIDSYSRVIATTMKQPHFTDGPAKATLTDPALCVKNTDTDLQGTSPREGCLLSAAAYPYRPLQSQGTSFLQTPKKSLLTVTVDGENFYAVSERVKTRFSNMTFNVILFSPESDVLGDVEKGRNIAIGVTAGVFVIGAAAAMFFTARLLRALTMVSEELYKMAQLDDFAAVGGSGGAGATNAAAGRGADSAAGSTAGRGGGGAGGDGASASSHGQEMTNRDRYRTTDSMDAQATGTGSVSGGAGGAGAVVPAGGAGGADQQGAGAGDRSMVSEFAALQSAYSAMNAAMRSFTKYVPKDVVRELMAKKELCTIAMVPLRCTMLFMDINNFTSMCEHVDTATLSELVKLYFERMSKQVMYHGGIVDKYIGDVIMAVWGAPNPIDNQEMRGCLCALGVARESRTDPLEAQFKAAGEELKIRVGVASGDVLAGNMGSDKRMSYTVIGDSVNLAARLQSFNRQWGTTTMIPEDVAAVVNRHLLLRTVIFASIVGKEQPCDIMEIVSVQPTLPDLTALDIAADHFYQTHKEAAAVQQQREAAAAAAAAAAASSSGAAAAASSSAQQQQDGNGGDTGSPSSVRSAAAARHKKMSELVRHHAGRGVASAAEISFVRQYNACSLALKERRFGEAVNFITALENDTATLSNAQRGHKSVKRIKEIAETAVAAQEIPRENLFGNFFVYRASEK